MDMPNLKLSLSGSLIVMVGVFVFVVLGALSHNDEPTKFLTSPITLITVVAIFLALTGVIKLNVISLLIIIALIVLTMYQGKVEDFIEELKWDIDYFKRKYHEMSGTGPYDPYNRIEILNKFHEKYAVKYSDTDYYVYIKQVDDLIKDRVGDTKTHNYFLIILPEVLGIKEGVPLATDTDTRITLYAIDHIAEVPIVVNQKVYTVRARAYLVKLNALEGTGTIAKWLGYNMTPYDFLYYPINLFKTNIEDFNKRVRGYAKYSDFVNEVVKHAYDLPDKLYIEGVV